MASEIRKILTLCIVRRDSKVLLGMKKRGFGAGRWNGFGGKLEEGETLREGSLRELKEECGLDAVEIQEKGVLDFSFQNDPKILEVHIFEVTKFIGEPKETEEMKPEWFDSDKIPFEQMWSDDIYWLPLLLESKKFKGRFLFDRPSTPDYSAVILEKELSEI